MPRTTPASASSRRASRWSISARHVFAHSRDWSSRFHARGRPVAPFVTRRGSSGSAAVTSLGSPSISRPTGTARPCSTRPMAPTGARGCSRWPTRAGLPRSRSTAPTGRSHRKPSASARRAGASPRFPASKSVLDPCGRGGERLTVRRLEHHRDLGPVVQEPWVASDRDRRVQARRLLEDPDDLAFAGAITSAPGPDRPAREPLRDAVEHGLHLARQPREDDDVLNHEPRRAAEWIGEGLRSPGQAGPAGGVTGQASRPEALPQDRCNLGELRALDAESGRASLTRNVVRRAAEPAGDEDVLDPGRLDAEKGADLLDVVANRRDQPHLDAQLGEPAGEPRGVRVLRVAGDDLVSDREDDRAGHASSLGPGDLDPCASLVAFEDAAKL